MKKTLVTLALSTVGFATAFAAAPATTPQTQPQQPASAQTAAKPVEVKKIAGKADEQKSPANPTTPGTPGTPAATPAKTKLALVADEKPGVCPTDKKDCAKDGQKTPAQTPAKTTPPKVALA